MSLPYNTNEATAEGHDGHAPRHCLDEDVLHRRERKPDVLGDHAEQAKAHEAGRQRHGAHPNWVLARCTWRALCVRWASLPSSLQTKVHVGEADDEAHQQADEDPAQRKAAPGDAPRQVHAGHCSIVLGQPVECHRREAALVASGRAVE